MELFLGFFIYKIAFSQRFLKGVRTVYLEIGAVSNKRLCDTLKVSSIMWFSNPRQQQQSVFQEKTNSPHACDNNISMATVSGDVSTQMMMMMMMKLRATTTSKRSTALTSVQHSLFLDELLGRERALLLLEWFQRLKRFHQLLHGGHFNRSTDLDGV